MRASVFFLSCLIGITAAWGTECVNDPRIANCLSVGQVSNPPGSDGGHGFTWNSPLRNSCPFTVEGVVTHRNGSTASVIVYASGGNDSCWDDCGGVVSIAPRCGFIDNPQPKKANLHELSQDQKRTNVRQDEKQAEFRERVRRIRKENDLMSGAVCFAQRGGRVCYREGWTQCACITVDGVATLMCPPSHRQNHEPDSHYCDGERQVGGK
jgi:hypothetical protein